MIFFNDLVPSFQLRLCGHVLRQTPAAQNLILVEYISASFMRLGLEAKSALTVNGSNISITGFSLRLKTHCQHLILGSLCESGSIGAVLKRPVSKGTMLEA